MLLGMHMVMKHIFKPLITIALSNFLVTIWLSEVWRKLITFSELYSLNESSVKSILGCLLTGVPYQCLFTNRTKSLEEILSILVA